MAIVPRVTYLGLLSALGIRQYPPGETWAYIAIGDFVTRLLMVAIPITLLFSITRYRLYDINFVINRSLIYASLTILLAAVGLAGFIGLSAVFGWILRRDLPQLSAAISAGIIVGIFAPARNRLKRVIDQRLYGIGLNYDHAIKVYRGLQRDSAPVSSASTFYHFSQLELIGQGGMGQVYKAFDTQREQVVALKMLPSHLESSDPVKARFQREAETISKLEHPLIVGLFDYGDYEGRLYMVMPFIEGRVLSDIINEFPDGIPVVQATNILGDVASALDYAHSQGIVHRDVKPGNVMIPNVTDAGSAQRQQAILMDFGIAKLQQTMTELTGTGGMVGTLDYIAPEQIQGHSTVDNRADVYSLGVMAFNMFTGQLPFRHNNPGALVLAHLMEPAPDPRSILPELSLPIARAIARAMSKLPEGRFDTAGEMVEAMKSE